MQTFQFDHVHLRSPDPDATARFFETMFDAEVTRGVYPPGTLYPAAIENGCASPRPSRTIPWKPRPGASFNPRSGVRPGTDAEPL